MSCQLLSDLILNVVNFRTEIFFILMFSFLQDHKMNEWFQFPPVIFTYSISCALRLEIPRKMLTFYCDWLIVNNSLVGLYTVVTGTFRNKEFARLGHFRNTLERSVQDLWQFCTRGGGWWKINRFYVTNPWTALLSNCGRWSERARPLEGDSNFNSSIVNHDSLGSGLLCPRPATPKVGRGDKSVRQAH